MTRLVLPIPPSVNTGYRNFTTPTGRRMRIPTDKAKKFKWDAVLLAKVWARKQQWYPPPDGTKIRLKVWFFWPDKRRYDQDNRLKFLQDAFTGVLWTDDRWVLPQVMDFDVDRENPRLEVELEKVDTVQPK